MNAGSSNSWLSELLFVQLFMLCLTLFIERVALLKTYIHF